MAASFRAFRVHVVSPDGRQGVVERLVSNVPKDLDDAGAEQYVRELWAIHYPGESYPSIEPIRDDEPAPRPTPGMFPAGVDFPR